MIAEVSGVAGVLAVGGRTAARLGPWRVTVGENAFADGWTLTGALVARDGFWLASDGAAVLTLDMGHHRWRWRDVAFSAGDESITIRGKGTPEVL